ncbi:MAG: hypothetical protein KGR48_05940 [Alphaproteobacteria bacterium]|nr:hypothetical protein [Alphaproteobacteria bacterium]MBU6474131.1 hypothetical protein [Alphaproteobacteria bacterium]MDE2011517.1 hypothetical protein [Alphaproteobacteria bacterium]MDE2075156.1 hypothetical protein [Alphaproteobacteria bacterium]
MPAEVSQFDALKAVTRTPQVSLRSPTAVKLRERAQGLVREEGLGESRYALRIVPLEKEDDGYLTLEGETVFAPWLVPASGRLTALGVGLVTLGPALEARVRALFAEKQAALALALDQFAGELLFATGARLEVRLRMLAKRQGLSLSGELHPGDPGLALEAQQNLMRWMAPDTLEISLHNGHLLNPLKSGSVIFGIGENLPAATWSRCDLCPSRAKCAKAERRHEAGVPA